MSQEPECVCPQVRGGGIDHYPDCAWSIWKQTGKLPVKLGITHLSMHRIWVPTSLRSVPNPLLVESIKLQGVVNAIEVRINDDGDYTILHGVQRFLAAELLGHKSIPAIIHD